MPKHGIFVTEVATSVTTPITASVGVPFVIGAAPLTAAAHPADVNVPVQINHFDEFVDRFGWSDDWDSYPLCEFAYSQFKLFGVAPVIFANVLDLATMKTAVAAADVDVVSRQASLPAEAIASSVVVKAAGGSGSAYSKGTDYEILYADGACIVELLSSSSHADETALNIAYDKATPASVTSAVVRNKLDVIDLCMPKLGLIPDLIVAPKYSADPVTAALMATKAAALNGVFSAKAIADIDSSSGGVTSYSGISAYKTAENLVDKALILCWPEGKLGAMKFHLSTQLAGLMALVDSGNGNPYESPSNKALKMDALCLDSGAVLDQTKAQADAVNAAGVVTALNFLASGWVCWGNYTSAYPASGDVKDVYIPVSRMFGWVGNTCVRTFWAKLDKPMNRRLLDTIVDSCNIWLNGLVGQGFLYGARVELLDAENPLTDLMAGIIRLHIYMTPPAPAQEIDFLLEYDASYVTEALA